MSFAISIVTFCKGRSLETRESVPAMCNALRTGDELVYVDYDDDGDGAERAVKYAPDKLTVVRFAPARWFHTNHARNIGVRAASGDIIIVADIDFCIDAALVEECRSVGDKQYYVQMQDTGSFGFLAVKWDWWREVQGYEEAMCAYGHDDIYMRMSLNNCGLVMRTCLNRVRPVQQNVGCRIHQVEDRGTTDSCNIQIGRWLRTLHRYRCNMSRNWASGGVIVHESEARKNVDKARRDVSASWWETGRDIINSGHAGRPGADMVVAAESPVRGVFRV